MMSRTLALGTLFSGGGGVECGAIAAGWSPVWAVERDEQIASVHANNFPASTMHCQPIETVDPCALEQVDGCCLSPMCQCFSAANSGAEESPRDISAAQASARILTHLRPRAVVLENVGKYRSSQSLRIILDALYGMGYCVTIRMVNAADFGVPQTRKRLIVVAVLGQSPPAFPAPVQWRGWLSAIADMVDTLPETDWAPWQAKRLPRWLAESTVFLPQESHDRHGNGYGRMRSAAAGEPMPTVTTQTPGWYRAWLVDGRNTRTTMGKPETLRFEDEPSFTVCAADGAARHRACIPYLEPLQGDLFGGGILVDGTNARPSGKISARTACEPALTVVASNKGFPRALLVADQYGQSNAHEDRKLLTREGEDPAYTICAAGKLRDRAWLECGRVVAMIPRALARFQTIPDWYKLPAHNGLAAKVIGNAVPSLLAEVILRQLGEML